MSCGEIVGILIQDGKSTIDQEYERISKNLEVIPLAMRHWVFNDLYNDDPGLAHRLRVNGIPVSTPELDAAGTDKMRVYELYIQYYKADIAEMEKLIPKGSTVNKAEMKKHSQDLLYEYHDVKFDKRRIAKFVRENFRVNTILMWFVHSIISTEEILLIIQAMLHDFTYGKDIHDAIIVKKGIMATQNISIFINKLAILKSEAICYIMPDNSIPQSAATSSAALSATVIASASSATTASAAASATTASAASASSATAASAASASSAVSSAASSVPARTASSNGSWVAAAQGQRQQGQHQQGQHQRQYQQQGQRQQGQRQQGQHQQDQRQHPSTNTQTPMAAASKKSDGWETPKSRRNR